MLIYMPDPSLDAPGHLSYDLTQLKKKKTYLEVIAYTTMEDIEVTTETGYTVKDVGKTAKHCILCLDDGGTRGVASLYILQRLMIEAQAIRGLSSSRGSLRSCLYFTDVN